MIDEIQDRSNGHRYRASGDSPVLPETNLGSVRNDPPQQSTASLLSGILGDLQHLVEQQFQLTRREIEDEIRKRARAAAVFALGAALLFVGAIVACLGLVHLLHFVSLPRAAEPAEFPLWACHGVVAAVLAAIGGILVLVGRARFRSTESFHNPLSELLKEHTP